MRISRSADQRLLNLYPLRPREPDVISQFRRGCEDVMGNLHNLSMTTQPVNICLASMGDEQRALVVRGDTNGEALTAMEQTPDGLLERLRVASEPSIRCNQLITPELRRLMHYLEAACARAPISRAESP